MLGKRFTDIKQFSRWDSDFPAIIGIIDCYPSNQLDLKISTGK
jgi:hypothetical protein